MPEYPKSRAVIRRTTPISRHVQYDKDVFLWIISFSKKNCFERPLSKKAEGKRVIPPIEAKKELYLQPIFKNTDK